MQSLDKKKSICTKKSNKYLFFQHIRSDSYFCFDKYSANDQTRLNQNLTPFPHLTPTIPKLYTSQRQIDLLFNSTCNFAKFEKRSKEDHR